MKLSVAVMAHESRAHLWEPLVDSIGDAFAFVDDGTLGRWGNGRRCLLAYDPGATHHLVIQDDAVPALDLIAAIEAWLPHLPESILCLYSGRVRDWRRIHDARSKPPCWLQMKQIQWGVALVVPTRIIEDTVRVGDRMPRIGNYDLRLSEANLRMHKVPVLVPSPSWVDHAYAESTVPGRKPNRHALMSIPAEQSVFDWFPDPRYGDIIRVPEFYRRPNGQQYYARSR